MEKQIKQLTCSAWSAINLWYFATITTACRSPIRFMSWYYTSSSFSTSSTGDTTSRPCWPATPCTINLKRNIKILQTQQIWSFLISFENSYTCRTSSTTQLRSFNTIATASRSSIWFMSRYCSNSIFRSGATSNTTSRPCRPAAPYTINYEFEKNVIRLFILCLCWIQRKFSDYRLPAGQVPQLCWVVSVLSPLHAVPPFSSWVDTIRTLIFVPVPHVTLQADHDIQLPHTQFTEITIGVISRCHGIDKSYICTRVYCRTSGTSSTW